MYPIPASRPDPHVFPDPSADIEDRKNRRCGTYALPITIVTFYPGPRGQGQRVKASPLILCPGNTRGSEPRETIYEQQFACLKAAQPPENLNWVRGGLDVFADYFFDARRWARRWRRARIKARPVAAGGSAAHVDHASAVYRKLKPGYQ
jgi:hypothetical protein